MKKSISRGFSLIELAIVLMIVALLLGGLIVPLSTQVDQGKINETRIQQEILRESLIGFALTHGRLPCPAQASLPRGDANAGVEATNSSVCTCQSSSGSTKSVAYISSGNVTCASDATSITGVVPWVTLGVPETDAWNRRYTYRVTRAFAQTSTKFTLSSSGVPDVISASSGGNPVADNVPAISISHGKNGLGAYNTDGTQISGASGDEAENSDNDNTFVYHNQDESFDDLVTWLSPNVLFNRMVAAGKLP